VEIVIDTSAIIAVLLEEPERDALVETTTSHELLAPSSVHWEIGNAFSAMLKSRRFTLQRLRRALASYAQIAIRFSDVELDSALQIADDLGIYAYDAYVLACAFQYRCAILSLDQGLLSAAKRAGVRILEVRS
jgi:predicted nucleic acid-binding protein